MVKVDFGSLVQHPLIPVVLVVPVVAANRALRQKACLHPVVACPDLASGLTGFGLHCFA